MDVSNFKRSQKPVFIQCHKAQAQQGLAWNVSSAAKDKQIKLFWKNKFGLVCIFSSSAVGPV